MERAIASPDRRPRVGTRDWERAGGPPLSFAQRLSLLGGTAAVLLGDLGPRLRWQLARRGILPHRWPAKVDLARWTPPDTRAARDAEQYLRQVSSVPSINHSLRSYYFSAVLYELSPVKPPIDREALYVAILLHDVGLFEVPRPAGTNCFTVGGAREARRIARDAGWDEARQDRVAVAITSNLNPSVSLEKLGPEAHFFRQGGLVDVIAQEWKLHPENLAPILQQHPRDGFVADTVEQVGREARLNPGGRFACFGFLFPTLVRITSFRADAPSRQLLR